MDRPPSVPPIKGWFTLVKDPKTGQVTGVEPSQALYKYMTGEFGGIQTNINSGVAQARAEAAAALAAADGASQAAQDVGANSLAFSIALSVPSLSAYIAGAGTATTGNVTVTPTGGTAPYTYAWTLVSGDALTLSGAAAATTNFSSALISGESKDAVYRITVTDNAALTRSLSIGVGLLSIAGLP